MEQRKCSHWLKSFTDWIVPRSDAPESFITWTGLFCLAAALRRRVFIGKQTLGGWTCYPFLYVIFVAPPGYRKTTTLLRALELFDDLKGLTSAPTACSQAALSLRLSESPDTSVYIVAEEFSDLLLKSGNEMYEFLTSCFDGRKKFETYTIKRNIEFIDNPCINMAAGATPIWIAKNFPEESIGGGFASRVIFIYEEDLRTKELYYTHVNMSDIDNLQGKLAWDLNHISNLAGEFSIEEAAMKSNREWYEDLTTQIKKKPPKLQGFYMRKHVYLHKIAQLWHVSYSDDLILNTHDFESALALLDMTEERLPRVFEGIGKNIYTFDTRSIYTFILQKKSVTRTELMDQFLSVGTADMIAKLLQHLTLAGKIVAKQVEEDIVYEAV